MRQCRYEERRHPIFARFFDRLSRCSEREVGVYRDSELRFLEHVRADEPVRARFQVLLDRAGIWPLLGGGCHCSRSTVGAITAAGFRVHECESLAFGRSWWITNPHMRGAARAPGEAFASSSCV
jgi:hypothetical protein